MNLLVILIKDIDFWSIIFGLIGVILLYFFGLSPKINQEGHINLILEQIDKNESNKTKIYKNWGYLGIIFVGISYLLQLLNLIFIC